MKSQKELNKEENNSKQGDRVEVARSIADVDILSLLLIGFGCLMLYQSNVNGWFLVVLGLLKYQLDK